jgi:hypothetical protein
MKTSKLYAPEAAEMAAGAEPIVNDSTNRTPLIPRTDYGIGLLAERAAQKWEAVPKLILLYTTQPEFTEKSASYLGLLDRRKKDGGERSPLTAGLEQADSDMDKGIRQVKTYLGDKYDKMAKDYYPLFGIERHGRNWRLPYNRSKRREVFKQIIESVEKQGFSDQRYGTKFWTELAARYEGLLKNATGTDGRVSVQVSSKKELKEWLVMVLNSLAKIIEGNYPTTFKGELRDWGFQKNQY